MICLIEINGISSFKVSFFNVNANSVSEAEMVLNSTLGFKIMRKTKHKMSIAQFSA